MFNSAILLAINSTIPWYIWYSGFGSLSVYVSCSLSVVAYLGSKENASILNGSQGSWARMLGESLEMLHMDFLSLMRSLSTFLMFGTNKRWYKRHIQCMGE